MTFTMLLAGPAAGGSSKDPEPYQKLLSQSQQALVVTTAGWNTMSGAMRLFVKAGGNWKQKGDAVPVVVGKNGLAWDSGTGVKSASAPVKHEGDGRSPAGVFPIAAEFGFAASAISAAMPYQPLTDQTECVDDTDSRVYNKVVDRNAVNTDWNSSERMLSVPGYRIGAIVSYNADRKKGAGSCIFLHVWSAPDKGTTGCTAMEEANLRPVLEQLDLKKHPVLIQMPETEFASLRKPWRLP